ncbi:dynein intermediate chain 1, axonemal-like isoform X2 [Stegodyphus dumicola]|nr:dynein intermediate chain 1, axonemal-like isoform X2 [Stegodyphus dumicola]XP_035219793.1 dynein intermediate chain 1, axonemal-like isoform X2 [Stegodyphus dumicola]
MRNKFNFRSVETQTGNSRTSDQGSQIFSSEFPVLKFEGTVSRLEIITAYREKNVDKKENLDDTQQKREWSEEEMKSFLKQLGRKHVLLHEGNCNFLRLCERMIDQNSSQANLDFRYYDNPNDEFCPGFGSLLPLWNFSCRAVKDMTVTSISWNSSYLDLFAVGFRNYVTETDAENEDNLGLIQEAGCLCIYSLKGPSYPERIIACPWGICCLEFHPEWPHLLAVGSVGGSVAIFDLRRNENSPAGCNLKFEKNVHRDTVSQVTWLPDRLPQKLCSVSMDGQIINWLFLLNDLFSADVVTYMRIKDWPLDAPPKGIEMNIEPKEIQLEDMGLKISGTSISVNKIDEDLIVVGTESGRIHKCSFEEKSSLKSYDDHKHSIHSVHWNSIHPRVFLSCSEDLSIRIWDHTLKESVFEFFFENEVKDVCWAPFSSTLFAAVSGNATIHIFDLLLNKLEAIGTYMVYTAKENINLTTLKFHPEQPVILAGDERGKVSAFKLSPNLRSSLKALETLDKEKFISGEIEKMEKLLAPAKGKRK